MQRYFIDHQNNGLIPSQTPALWEPTRRQLCWVFPPPLQPLPQRVQLLLVRLDVAPCVRHDELQSVATQTQKTWKVLRQKWSALIWAKNVWYATKNCRSRILTERFRLQIHRFSSWAYCLNYIKFHKLLCIYKLYFERTDIPIKSISLIFWKCSSSELFWVRTTSASGPTEIKSLFLLWQNVQCSWYFLKGTIVPCQYLHIIALRLIQKP